MKLLVKTSLYYLILSIPVLIIAGGISYFIISSEVKTSNNELLLKRKLKIENYIQLGDSISWRFITQSGEATVLSMQNMQQSQDIFSDTLIFDSTENELAPNSLLTSISNIGNKTYFVRIWRSTIEFDELVEGIITGMVFIYIFLLVVFIGINWWVSRSLWKPFYQILESLKAFRPNSKQSPEILSTSIREFKALNQSVSEMMDKMIADFKRQKQFTENASHEMQTPLAIIKAKIDLLIQSDKLTENETDLIVEIENSCTKLSRLNKSLLLLTKIENRQFVTEEVVSINKVLDDSIALFKDDFDSKHIKLTKVIESEKFIRINPDLCSVLVNNLIQNAIRHNKEKGNIEILLTDEKLFISNTGALVALDETKIFDRFQKNVSSHDSLGLGLAIVKEIADINGLEVIYSYTSNTHSFSIIF